jgi:hypothetical protein
MKDEYSLELYTTREGIIGGIVDWRILLQMTRDKKVTTQWLFALIGTLLDSFYLYRRTLCDGTRLKSCGAAKSTSSNCFSSLRPDGLLGGVLFGGSSASSTSSYSSSSKSSSFSSFITLAGCSPSRTSSSSAIPIVREDRIEWRVSNYMGGACSGDN